MGWLDWVPTPIEILGWVTCRLSDHDYNRESDGVVRCSDCRKEKPQ